MRNADGGCETLEIEESPTDHLLSDEDDWPCNTIAGLVLVAASLTGLYASILLYLEPD